uniref:Lipocalin n=1 Tax=Rhipicephalus zambeziensis TaxID=60191 RepID=A0A224YL73_9ACAR
MDQCPKHVKTPCILRRKGKQRIMKLLMYYHRDHHCAVYKVIGLTEETECEIHAWDSALLQYKTIVTYLLSCEEQFYKYCNETQHTQRVYYSDSCTTS